VKKKESVNHPDHYNSHPAGIECIDVVEHMNFNCGNAIKYIWRNGLKKSAGKEDIEKQVEDLKKARWYIDREIDRLKWYNPPEPMDRCQNSGLPTFHIRDKHFSHQVDTIHDCVVLDKPENVDIMIGMNQFCSHSIRLDFTKCNGDVKHFPEWIELCRFTYVPDDRSTCASLTALINKDQVDRTDEVLTMLADQLPDSVS
jgi:hypothetical protein